MGASRTLLRKLDLDLVERIEANGRIEKSKKIKSQKKPKPGARYRGARRNADRVKGWPGATFAKARPLARDRGVALNRSSRWRFALTYAAAREVSPSSEPLR